MYSSEIPLKLLNPTVTKQFTKATVRKKKTDATDALVIAQCALNGEGDLVTKASLDPAKLVLRTLTKLGQMEGAIKRMESRFPEHAPELTPVISGLRSISSAITEEANTVRESLRERIDQKHVDLLSSIPGIGSMLAPIFIAEIESIERFKNPKSLVAYTGLDPRVKQFRTSLMHNTRLTKQGSPFLQRAAFIAASIAQRYDQELRSYYEKKRHEGKRYREATIANVRHILNRIYAVWKRGTP